MKCRIAVSWQVWYLLSGLSLAAFGAYFISAEISQASHIEILLLVLMMFFPVVGLGIIINTLRTSVIVDDQKLTVTTLFVSRSIVLDDIRGYGIGYGDQFYLIPNGNEKNIYIPEKLINRKKLIAFFKKRYKDVEEIQMKEETNRILDDDRFGSTRGERATKLDRTKTLALVLNFLPILFALIAMNNKAVYAPMMWIVFSFPWIVAILTRYLNGLTVLLPIDNNPSPSFIFSLTLTAMGSFFGVVPRFNFVNISSAAEGIFIAISFAVFGLYALVTGNFFEQAQKRKWSYLGFGVIFCIYSSMLILFTNCEYDPLPPRHLLTIVQGKTFTGGKDDSYDLKLSAWGTYPAGNKFSVSSRLFEAVEIGDSVDVNLFAGRWGLAWYRMHRWGVINTTP